MGTQFQSGRCDVVASVPPKSRGRILGDSGTRRGRGKLAPLLACFLLLGLVTQVRADIIAMQPLNANISGAFSNLEPGSPHQQIADNFQLFQVTTLESLSWFGRYGMTLSLANPVDFSIRFFADDGGRPAVSPVQEFDVMTDAHDTGLTFQGVPWFSYAIALPDLTLKPGNYWVSVLESDPRTPASGLTQWLWGQSDQGDRTVAVRGTDGATWTRISNSDQAFSLTGSAVPEPSGFWLWVLGLSGLAWFQRRPTGSAAAGWKLSRRKAA
jgi:hypothetical protein